MTDDCKFVESNLEDFLTDQADAATQGRLEQHLETCKGCRDEVAGYEEVDRRVGVYFDRQVAIANAGRSVRVGTFAAASVMAGVALVALVLWLPGSSDQPVVSVPMASESPATGEAVVDEVAKATDLPATSRAKPATDSGEGNLSETIETIETIEPMTSGGEVAAPLDQAFAVTDPAGYSYTMSDFSGSVMVIAVFDEQSSGVPAFQQAYDAFGATPNLRFLGVTLTPSSQPDGVTFPVMLNRGSSLVGTPAGEFVVVTAEGKVHTRGSLENDALIARLGATLRELGIR